MFASSEAQGRPARINVDGTLAGLKEALQLMTEGEKRRIWVPESLTGKGWPEAPKGDLVFEVEVIELIAGTVTVPVPEDVAAPPADGQKTKSGLVSKVLGKGEGKVHPKATDTVKVNYSGWTTDGKMFDSSVTKGEASAFPLNAVIAGWTEGLQLMVEGEKRRLWIPEALAYKGMEGKPKGMLVFDVELLEILVAPKAPVDVKAPPADAQKTASGLSSKVLTAGAGKRHPGPTSRVKAQYTGWTTDGKVFDSSITRGQPGSFSLTEVIAGWTEGLQLMVEGEKRRFWIPEELAYKGRKGKPKGMLVFDVELVSIQEP
jgi:FKBP-type peptidyl-prolyl cis-trans isomerase